MAASQASAGSQFSSDMTAEALAQWLLESRIPKESCDKLKAQAIDGDVFPDLSLDELQKMGFLLGPAKKIFRLVEAQRGTPEEANKKVVTAPENGHKVKEQVTAPPVEPATPAVTGLLQSQLILDERPEMRELQLIKWYKGGQEKHLRIKASAAPRWKDLGTTFGISPAELQGFERQNLLDQEGCCYAVLQRWLQNGSQPRDAYAVTWRGLIQALRDTSLREIADELQTALCKSSNSSDVAQQSKPLPATPRIHDTRLEPRELVQLLTPVAASWDLFARQLGVPHTQTDLIAANIGNVPDRISKSLDEAINWWITNAPNPSLKDVVKVLEGPVITNRVLAKEIRKHISKPLPPTPRIHDTRLEPRELVQLLTPVAASWDLFARQLGVPHTQTDLIAANIGNVPDRISKYLDAAINWWITNAPNPSLKDVVKVLEGPVITNRVLAREIRKHMT